MIFDKPIPFTEALKARAVKQLLPTAAGSAEIAKLEAPIRERSMFSAKVVDLPFLSQADKLIEGIVSPSSAQGAVPGRQSPFNAIEARAKLQDYLDSIGYQPEPGKEGGLQDLGSNMRLDLIINMNVREAHGYGQFEIQNNPTLIDDIPCLELVRNQSRKVPREWESRWISKGGKLYAGRMIARKDDSIWTAISRFDRPYPPFDYNSGMGTREIFRDEAEELGVIKRSTVIKPQSRNFNDNVEAAFPQGISSGLAAALKQVFKVVGDKIILEALK